MLWVPGEIAAIIATKAVVVAVESVGHDPLRAAGALLLELPGLASRLVDGQSNVLRLSYKRRRPENGWEYLAEAARRRDVKPSSLWSQFRPQASELNTPVLPA